MSTWLEKLREGYVDFSLENIMFGFKGRNNNPLNVVCLLVKQKIYNMSRKGQKPNFKIIHREIVKYYQASKYIAFINNDQPKFYAFWSSFHTLLTEN